MIGLSCPSNPIQRDVMMQHKMSEEEISEVHRDEIHVMMHEMSDEEINEEC